MLDLHVSDLVDLREVEVSYLEIAVFAVLMSEVIHELGYCLSQIRLVPVELVHNVSDEEIIAELEVD